MEHTEALQEILKDEISVSDFQDKFITRSEKHHGHVIYYAQSQNTLKMSKVCQKNAVKFAPRVTKKWSNQNF